MRYTIYLNDQQEKALKVYRDKRRAERGKVIQTATALAELFDKALAGIEPAMPLADRVAALEVRMDEIAPAWKVQVQAALDNGADKLTVIKLYRRLTSSGLKDAKDSVEHHWPALRFKHESGPTA